MSMRTPDEERSLTFQYALLGNKAAQVLSKVKNGQPLTKDDKHKLGLVIKFLENAKSVCKFWGQVARNDRAAAFHPSQQEWQDHGAFSAVASRLHDLLPGRSYDPRRAREQEFIARVEGAIAKRQKSYTNAAIMETLTQAIYFFRKMHDEMTRRYEIADSQCAEFDDAG